jgi:P-type conjugative transfer protein TrbG
LAGIVNEIFMRPLLLAILLAFLASSIFGQVPSPSPSSKFDSDLLGGTNPVLNGEEREGVNITQAWKDKSLETMVGHAGENASVQFRFGESLPSIVAAVLQVTDVELEKGEVITHINLGDSTRWTVESAISGSGSEAVEHIIVKPRDIGLSTSLIVTTNRRTYHLLLVSDAKEFMHDVTFVYATPPPLVAAATPVPSPVAKDPPKDPPRRKKVASGKEVIVSDPPDDADDNYVVRGRANFAPTNVYTKDGKTYLEMPPSVKNREAPVLFEERKSGLFGHSKNLCNYRVHGKWYVVDRVLDNAVLVSGVGSGQQKVIVRHSKKKEVPRE